MKKLKPFLNYLLRIAEALSQLINVVVFFGDNPNEQVSGRAYRMRRINWQWAALRWAINFLFFWQQDHCRDSHVADLKRAEKTLHNR